MPAVPVASLVWSSASAGVDRSSRPSAEMLQEEAPAMGPGEAGACVEERAA